MIMPGFTTAAQYSGSPLPLPMRVSAGMAVTDLCGKTRMYSRPSPRTLWAAVTRPASIASALSQPPSSDCRPNSPIATKLPRWALPLTLPRWVLRNLTRLGIIAMTRPPKGRFREASRTESLPQPRAAPVPAARAPRARRPEVLLRLLFDEVVAVVHPHLDADVALGRGRLGEAVLHLGPQGRERDAPLHAALHAGHFRAAQPAGQLHPHALGPVLHRQVDRPLDRPPEARPLLQLDGDLLGHQLRVDLRPVDLERLDLDAAVREVFEVLGQLLDLGALLADDHADLGRIDLHRDLLARPLDADLRDARARVLLLDVLPDRLVLDQEVREVRLAGVPGTLPPGHDTDAEAGRSHFLAHRRLSSWMPTSTPAGVITPRLPTRRT